MREPQATHAAAKLTRESASAGTCCPLTEPRFARTTMPVAPLTEPVLAKTRANFSAHTPKLSEPNGPASVVTWAWKEVMVRRGHSGSPSMSR